MTSALAIAGIAISFGAVGVSSASAFFSHRQLKLAEQLRARDFEANVVAELVGVHRHSGEVEYEVAVTNAGPAVARDVGVAIVEWRANKPFGRRLSEALVAPALLRGERRVVRQPLPAEAARFDDRSSSTELHSDYFDDNGVRNLRLGLVFEDSFVLTPPEPKIS